MKAIADTMGVARSRLIERMKPKVRSALSPLGRGPGRGAE
jgi:hypothetical protein